MIPSLKNRLHSCLSAAALVVTSLAITGCGGGGGESTDPRSEPAPQTLHAVTLTLYSGGVKFTFLRDSGDTLKGENELGSVIYTDRPGTTTTNTVVELLPSDKVSNLTYVYTRDSAQSGTIVIKGIGSGEFDDGKAIKVSNYFAGDGLTEVTRTYKIDFASSGGEVNTPTIYDYSDLAPEGPTSPGYTWYAGFIELYSSSGGGTRVPVGYSITRSLNQELPTLFPASIGGADGAKKKILTLGPTVPEFVFNFATSDYVKYINDANLIEVGVCSQEIPAIIQNLTYRYEPTFGTIDKVKLTITENGNPKVYNLVFGDPTSGNCTGDYTGPFKLEDIP